MDVDCDLPDSATPCEPDSTRTDAEDAAKRPDQTGDEDSAAADIAQTTRTPNQQSESVREPEPPSEAEAESESEDQSEGDDEESDHHVPSASDEAPDVRGLTDAGAGQDDLAAQPDQTGADSEAGGDPSPLPADNERLRRVLTQFPATPLFAQMLAHWNGPAASIVTADRPGERANSEPAVVDLRDAQQVPVAQPRDAHLTSAQPHQAAPASASSDIDEHAESDALSVDVSGGLRSMMVTARGEVRADTAGLLFGAGRRALDMSPLRLIVDLQDVSLFSAAGLRALLELRQAAAKEATEFRLRAPSAAVCAALEATSTRVVFRIDGGEPGKPADSPLTTDRHESDDRESVGLSAQRTRAASG